MYMILKFFIFDYFNKTFYILNFLVKLAKKVFFITCFITLQSYMFFIKHLLKNVSFGKRKQKFTFTNL